MPKLEGEKKFKSSKSFLKMSTFLWVQEIHPSHWDTFWKNKKVRLFVF